MTPDNKRINSYLRDLGYGTRRSVEALIEKGFVYINGKKATLGDKVGTKDKVEIKTGKKDVMEDYIYLAYNKPKGVSTLPDVGQKSIKDMIGKYSDTVFPIGRLDKDSSGLIILTNDGRITDKLLNPKFEHEKEYHVRVNKKINNTLLKSLKEGVRVGEFRTKPAKVRKINENTFDIILTEGQNRQIRRMCAAFGYDVKSLERFRIENISLSGLRSNQIRIIRDRELKNFLKVLGL